MGYDQQDYDPYAIPESNLADPWQGAHGGWDKQGPPLADIGTRLGARMIDWLTQCLAMLPAVAILVVGISQNPNGRLGEAWLIGSIAAMALFLIVLFGVNCYYLYENGQTIGKKALGIKIVAQDGSRASFASILGLRIFVMGFLESLPLGIGLLVGIVNVCMIFGQDRRCLHDLLASTIVVRA